jgi:hypothetical protein
LALWLQVPPPWHASPLLPASPQLAQLNVADPGVGSQTEVGPSGQVPGRVGPSQEQASTKLPPLVRTNLHDSGWTPSLQTLLVSATPDMRQVGPPQVSSAVLHARKQLLTHDAPVPPEAAQNSLPSPEQLVALGGTQALGLELEHTLPSVLQELVSQTHCAAFPLPEQISPGPQQTPPQRLLQLETQAPL